MKKIFTLFAAVAMTAAVASAQDTYISLYHGDQLLENEAAYSVGYTFDDLDEEYSWDADLKVGFNSTVTTFLYEVTSTATIETCPNLPGSAPGTCFIVAPNEPKLVEIYNGVTFDEETPIASLGIHRYGESELPAEPVVVTVRAYEDGFEDEAVTATVTFVNTDQASVKVEKADAQYVRLEGDNLVYRLDGDATLVVCDASGRKVLSVPVKGNGSVSLASLPTGLYLFRAGSVSGKAMVR